TAVTLLTGVPPGLGSLELDGDGLGGTDGLAFALRRGLSDPARRPASAGELAAQLRAAAGPGPAAARPAAAPFLPSFRFLDPIAGAATLRVVIEAARMGCTGLRCSCRRRVPARVERATA